MEDEDSLATYFAECHAGECEEEELFAASWREEEQEQAGVERVSAGELRHHRSGSLPPTTGTTTGGSGSRRRGVKASPSRGGRVTLRYHAHASSSSSELCSSVVYPTVPMTTAAALRLSVDLSGELTANHRAAIDPLRLATSSTGVVGSPTSLPTSTQPTDVPATVWAEFLAKIETSTLETVAPSLSLECGSLGCQRRYYKEVYVPCRSKLLRRVTLFSSISAVLRQLPSPLFRLKGVAESASSSSSCFGGHWELSSSKQDDSGVSNDLSLAEVGLLSRILSFANGIRAIKQRVQNILSVSASTNKPSTSSSDPNSGVVLSHTLARRAEFAVATACNTTLETLFLEVLQWQLGEERRLASIVSSFDSPPKKRPLDQSVFLQLIEKLATEVPSTCQIVQHIEANWRALVDHVTTVAVDSNLGEGTATLHLHQQKHHHRSHAASGAADETLCAYLYQQTLQAQTPGSRDDFAFFASMFLIALWPYLEVLLAAVVGKVSLPPAIQQSFPALLSEPLASYDYRSVNQVVQALAETSVRESTAASQVVADRLVKNPSSTLAPHFNITRGSKETVQLVEYVLAAWQTVFCGDVEGEQTEAHEEEKEDREEEESIQLKGKEEERIPLILFSSLSPSSSRSGTPSRLSLALTSAVSQSEQLQFSLGPRIHKSGKSSTQSATGLGGRLLSLPLSVPFPVLVEEHLLHPMFSILDRRQYEDLLSVLELPPEEQPPAAVVGGESTTGKEDPQASATPLSRTILTRPPAPSSGDDDSLSLLNFQQALGLIEDVLLMRQWTIISDSLVKPLIRSKAWYQPELPRATRAHALYSALRTLDPHLPSGGAIEWNVNIPSFQEHEGVQPPSGDGKSKSSTAPTRTTVSTARRILETFASLSLTFKGFSQKTKVLFTHDVEEVYSGIFSFLLTLCYAQSVLQERWSELRSTRRCDGAQTRKGAAGSQPPQKQQQQQGAGSSSSAKWKPYAVEEEMGKEKAECVVNHMLLFVIDAVLQFYLHEAHALFANFKKDSANVKELKTVSGLLLVHEQLLSSLQHLSLSSRATESMWNKLCVVLALAIDPAAQQDRRERPQYAIHRVKVAVLGLIEALSVASTYGLSSSSAQIPRSGSAEDEPAAAQRTLPLLQILTMNSFFMSSAQRSGGDKNSPQPSPSRTKRH